MKLEEIADTFYALMSTFPDISAMDVRYYPGWKPKMNQQHQITTALDLIEMAIQDVVSPDV
jgi:hypothetical protein